MKAILTLWWYLKRKVKFSQITGREVDIVEEGRELKSFSQKIRKERVLVYGKKPSDIETNFNYI